MAVIAPDVLVLEAPAELAAIFAMWLEPTLQKPGRRDSIQPRHTRFVADAEPAPKGRAQCRSCGCAVCGRCRDNARWTRVYDEKFAAPSYYHDLKLRYNSSLAGA